MPKIIEVSRDNLQIEEKFCNFWAPLAFVMFSPSELIALTLCVIYGISAAYGVMLAQFALSLETIGALMIADVIIDNLVTGLDVAAHECELLMVSHKEGFIKET